MSKKEKQEKTAKEIADEIVNDDQTAETEEQETEKTETKTEETESEETKSSEDEPKIINSTDIGGKKQYPRTGQHKYARGFGYNPKK